MINYWLDVALCSLVVLAELAGAIALAIAIQFIFVKIFRINLVLRFLKFLDRFDKKINWDFGVERRKIRCLVGTKNITIY